MSSGKLGLLRHKMLKTAVLALLLAMAVPALVHFSMRQKFAVHKEGGVFITGASTGIGQHAALGLTRKGFVVFAGVRKEADGKALLDLCKHDCNPELLVPVICDVTKSATIETSIAHIKKDLDKRSLKLVGLVNNAGISVELPLEVQSIDNVKAVFDVNVIGLVAVTQQVIPLLREAGSGARIVNIGSLAGKVSRPGRAVYSASKFAVEALTDGLRQELARWDISVSVVEPAFVKTEIAAKQIGDNNPARKLTPEQYSLYAHLFDRYDSLRLKSEEKADTPVVTTEAIAHALTSPYPETRYPVANFNGLPAWLVVRALWLAPDRVVDYVVNKPFQ